MSIPGEAGHVEPTYGTFWQRLMAAIIDFFVLLPIGLFVLAVGPRLTSPMIVATLCVLNAWIAVLYSILLHARHGQTLGKMVTHIRVVDVTGSAIGWRQAVLRDAPWLAFAAADCAWALLVIAEGKHPLRDPFESEIPLLFGLADLSWVLAELVTMLTNRRRRAIHDWIARTVVVRTRSEGRLAAASVTA